MMRNAKPGERCQVLSENGQPRTTGYRAIQEGATCGRWDFTQGNTGTVAQTIKRLGSRLVHVRPDPGTGFGILPFFPSQLRRITEEA